MCDISVVMPVYNGEQYLHEAIESVLVQTFSNFEFIIINDGSTDNSLDIIRTYAENDDRIRIISRENKGLVVSLNEGISAAIGKYIARMDADDICLPTRFEKQFSLMESTSIDICGAHYYLINEEGNYIDTAIVPIESDSFPIFLCYTTPFAHGSVMLKKSIFSQGIRYGMTKYAAAEDYALWSELYQRGFLFGNVDDFIFKYRDFNCSLSKKNKNKVKSDASKIAKANVKLYRADVLSRLNSKHRHCFSKREEEILAICIFILVFCRGELSLISNFKKISKRATVIGLMRFLLEII